MEVGSLREKIVIMLLIYRFGEANLETEIPIITISGKGFSGVKLIWTREFREDYYPHCDILLIQINWGSKGGFYYIPDKRWVDYWRED